MRVLVIGGTGFIGPPIVRRLVEGGHEVTVYHRGDHEPDLPASVEHVHHSGASVPTLFFPDQLRQRTYDLVLHMTLRGERDARAAMEAFHGRAKRLVMISSCDVYRAFDILWGADPGPVVQVPLHENSALRSRLYPFRGQIPGMEEYDKILAERIVLDDRALPATVLRLPMVYGPGDYRHRFFPYLKRMRDGRPAILLGADADWRGTWAHVENVAHATICAIQQEHAAGEVYNVAERPTRSTREWVEALGAVTGWKGSIVISLPDAAEGGQENWKQDLVTDTSHIRQDLGFSEVVTAPESLVSTAAWELEHPPAYSPEEFDYAAEDRVLETV